MANDMSLPYYRASMPETPAPSKNYGNECHTGVAAARSFAWMFLSADAVHTSGSSDRRFYSLSFDTQVPTDGALI